VTTAPSIRGGPYTADDRISLVTTYSRCKPRRGLRSRGGSSRLPMRARRCCLLVRRDHRPTHQCKHFGTQLPSGAALPVPFASSCAYASSTPLPECLQGSIPGPWLAVTWAGFAPARLRGIGKPRPPVASGWSVSPVGTCTHRKAPPFTAHTPSGRSHRALKRSVGLAKDARMEENDAFGGAVVEPRKNVPSSLSLASMRNLPAASMVQPV